MKILLVSPRTPDTFWSFKHAVRFVSRKASMAPLGLLTVAAMLPPEWELKLVDLNVRRLKDAGFALGGLRAGRRDARAKGIRPRNRRPVRGLEENRHRGRAAVHHRP